MPLADAGVGIQRPGRGVDRDHRVALFGLQCPDFDQGGHGPDGGVAAQVGIAPGIHVKETEGAVVADRFGHHGRHDSPVPAGLAGQQFANVVETVFEMAAFVLHCGAGQASNAAYQQPGRFSLGVGIDGDDAIFIALQKSFFEAF